MWKKKQTNKPYRLVEVLVFLLFQIVFSLFGCPIAWIRYHFAGRIQIIHSFFPSISHQNTSIFNYFYLNLFLCWLPFFLVVGITHGQIYQFLQIYWKVFFFFNYLHYFKWNALTARFVHNSVCCLYVLCSTCICHW